MATNSPPAPDSVDYLGLEQELTEEERAVRDSVRSLMKDRVLPEIGTWFEEGFFPRDLIPEFGKLGLLGMHLSGYGCAGSSATSYGVACRELEAADSGMRSLVSVQGSLAMFPIWSYGSESQKERWLPAMASGQAVGCFGLTEPDSGSDPSSMRTSARRSGGDWILNGTKMWITNGGIADVAVVWAQTDEGIRGFVVDTTVPGFETRDIKQKASLRASVTSELTMSDCRLPDAAVLPGVVGLRGPLSCLSEARFGIIWGAVGAARSCYEAALEYAGTREQFSGPIAQFQLTQKKLVDMLTELSKAQLLATRLGRMKDAGQLHPSQVSMGKLNNVREALEIARCARTILAANGITLEYPVMRHMNNLESVLTYEGTTEMHTLIIGQQITGLSAFS